MELNLFRIAEILKSRVVILSEYAFCKKKIDHLKKRDIQRIYDNCLILEIKMADKSQLA